MAGEIVPVNEGNVQSWAGLCARLWPEAGAEKMLGALAEHGPSCWPGMEGENFLYCLDGEPVGFINLSLRRDFVNGARSSPTAYIEGIYVTEESRGRGIGRELIRHAKLWALGRGCTDLASDALLENTGSRGFHARAGFEEAERVVCFVMRLDGAL